MARAGDTPPGDVGELDARIAEVFGGPLDGFVARRAALARELRTAGRRDDAEAVKALRKPKRAAWALDAGRLADPEAAAELAEAVAAVEAAPSSGGDVRAAIARLRAAEEAFVAAADGASRDHGGPVDPTVLAAALRAVVADPDLRAALQAGRLVDTAAVGDGPAASGAAAPPRSRTTKATRGDTAGAAASGRTAPAGQAELPDAAGGPTPSPRPDRRALTAARRAVSKAEDRAARAERAAREAAADEDSADAAAEEAEKDAAAARRRADDALDRARRARQVAATRAADQEAAAAQLAAAAEALRELGG